MSTQSGVWAECCAAALEQWSAICPSKAAENVQHSTDRDDVIETVPPEAPDTNLARTAVELPQLKTVRGPPPEHDELSEIYFVPANMNRNRTVPIGEILEDIVYTPREAHLREVPENDCLIRVTKPTR